MDHSGFPVREGSLVLYTFSDNGLHVKHERGIVFEIENNTVYVFWDTGRIERHFLDDMIYWLSDGRLLVEVF